MSTKPAGRIGFFHRPISRKNERRTGHDQEAMQPKEGGNHSKPKNNPKDAEEGHSNWCVMEVSRWRYSPASSEKNSLALVVWIGGPDVHEAGRGEKGKNLHKRAGGGKAKKAPII